MTDGPDCDIYVPLGVQAARDLQFAARNVGVDNMLAAAAVLLAEIAAVFERDPYGALDATAQSARNLLDNHYRPKGGVH